MSGPNTRPWGDNVPNVSIETAENSSTSSSVSYSLNHALPWVVIAIVATIACSLSGISLGLSIGARADAMEAKRIAREEVLDAKRIADRETRLLRVQLDDLRTSLKAQGLNIHEQETP